MKSAAGNILLVAAAALARTGNIISYSKTALRSISAACGASDDDNRVRGGCGGRIADRLLRDIEGKKKERRKISKSGHMSSDGESGSSDDYDKAGRHKDGSRDKNIGHSSGISKFGT